MQRPDRARASPKITRPKRQRGERGSRQALAAQLDATSLGQSRGGIVINRRGAIAESGVPNIQQRSQVGRLPGALRLTSHSSKRTGATAG
jgi:hypothetical protein